MASEDFDLGAIKELKYNAYVKQQCKPAMVLKGKSAVLFSKCDLIGAKKSFIAVFFNKPGDAKKAFDTVKKNKDHMIKRTALVSVQHGKGAEGAEVTLTILKGGLTADTIMVEGKELFENKIKMGLKVVGATSDSAEGSADNAEASAEDKGPKKEGEQGAQGNRAEKKAKRAAKHAQMQEGVAKMDAVKGKAPKEKLQGNIKKYEDALAKLIEEAKADGEIDAEEQAKITNLTKALEELKTAVESGAGEQKTKKLSVEERAKINENMNKIDEKLQKIMAKLKM